MVVIFDQAQKREQMENELRIRKRLYEVEQLRYDRLRSSQEETARLRHDFQNYLLVLRGLLEKEHSGEEGKTI